MTPDISYLILYYNPDNHSQATDALTHCVTSFYERKNLSLASEVYFIDQGGDDAHRVPIENLRRKYNFSTLYLERNVGISRGINLFARIARAPVLCLITSDAIFTDGLDDDLLHKVTRNKEIYQVCPLSDKSEIPYQQFVPREAFGSRTIDLSSLARGYIRCIVAELTISCWRREVFERIGYFDERWRSCYENLDFALRAFIDGGCIAVSRDSFAWHYHAMTIKTKARDKSYEGYIPMKEGFDHGMLTPLWHNKWPDLKHNIDIYNLLGTKTVGDFQGLRETFSYNIYLPLVQNVGY